MVPNTVAVTVQSAIFPTFSNIRLSLPDMEPKPAKNGGIRRVNVDYTYGVFELQGALWENKTYNPETDLMDVSYSFSFPRYIAPIKGNAAAQAEANDFRLKARDEATAFYKACLSKQALAKANGEVASNLGGRLVESRPLTEAERKVITRAQAK